MYIRIYTDMYTYIYTHIYIYLYITEWAVGMERTCANSITASWKPFSFLLCFS